MTQIVVFMHRGGESVTRKMEVSYSIQNCLAVLQLDGWIIDRWEVVETVVRSCPQCGLPLSDAASDAHHANWHRNNGQARDVNPSGRAPFGWHL